MVAYYLVAFVEFVLGFALGVLWSKYKHDKDEQAE